MSSVELFLIRHGETTMNVGQWTSTPDECSLTPLGLEQAKKSADSITKIPDLLISSPLVRAKQTSQFFTQRWPNCPMIILPIQEFVYLSPKRLNAMDKVARQEEISQYWLKKDPEYCDGETCESFASFYQRVHNFYHYLLQKKGFIIAIGHGQFFKAFHLNLTQGFTLNSNSMNLFRKQESATPIKNGEIIKVNL